MGKFLGVVCNWVIGEFGGGGGGGLGRGWVGGVDGAISLILLVAYKVINGLEDWSC